MRHAMRYVRRMVAWILVALGLLPAPGMADEATRILVNFADRSLLRTEFGEPGQPYAPVVHYGASAWSRDVTRALAEKHALRAVTEWPIQALGMHCVVFEVAPGADVETILARLAADRRVASVQRMHTFRTMGGDPYRALQGSLVSLDVGRAHRFATGRGVHVAIVDTGVDTTHPELRERIASAQDLVTEAPAAQVPAESHGTAVAGVIAAAADNGEGIVGVAPGATVHALRACWPLATDQAAAECNSLTLARALSAVLTMKPQVLNLSLGGPHDPLLSALLKLVIAQGTIVIAAEPPESAPAGTGFPTDVPEVIRVNPQDVPRAAAVLGAPGTRVLTTYPRGAYSFVSGSSYAAAHVAGIVALLKERQPQLSPAATRQILETTSVVHPVSGGAAVPARTASVSACGALAQVSHDVRCDAVLEAADRHRGAALVAASRPPHGA